MKKIVILGSNGMIGHTIYSYLNSLNKYKITDIARTWVNPDTHIIDVRTQADKLNRIIRNGEFDIMINCIGVLVKASDEDPENAIWINSYFPHWLEKITKNTKTKIINLSTDCVFSGKKGNYSDTDATDGIGVYANSKLQGEIINNKDLTIRMSAVGYELKKTGVNLFSWFLRQRGIVKGYSGAIWSGMTTLELAKAIDKLVDTGIAGLYHLAPEYSISKYHLLKLIQKIWEKKDVEIVSSMDIVQDRSLVNSKQKIPNYTMPGSYEIMFREYKEWHDIYHYDDLVT